MGIMLTLNIISSLHKVNGTFTISDHLLQLCEVVRRSTAVKHGDGLNNHFGETGADLQHSSSLLTAISGGNSSDITIQEPLTADTQRHAPAQTLSLSGSIVPQHGRDTRLSLDNSRHAAERLQFSRSIGAEVELLKWLLSQREQMLGYPLHWADLIHPQFRLTVTEQGGTRRKSSDWESTSHWWGAMMWTEEVVLFIQRFQLLSQQAHSEREHSIPMWNNEQVGKQDHFNHQTITSCWSPSYRAVD